MISKYIKKELDKNFSEHHMASGEEKKSESKEWTTEFINNLPDSAFAVLEPAYVNGDTEDKKKSKSQIQSQKRFFSTEQYNIEMDNGGEKGYGIVSVYKLKGDDNEQRMYIRVDGEYTKEEWVDLVSFIGKLSRNE